MHLIALLPALTPGDLERWLLGAAAVGTLVLIWRKLFGNGNTPARRSDLDALQKQVSAMHAELLGRLGELEATLARLDERTKRQ